MRAATVRVSIFLPISTIIYGSQAHSGPSPRWEVSGTISSILQMFQNVKLRLGHVKSLLRVAGKLGGGPNRKQLAGPHTERLGEAGAKMRGPAGPAQGRTEQPACAHSCGEWGGGGEGRRT